MKKIINVFLLLLTANFVYSQDNKAIVEESLEHVQSAIDSAYMYTKNQPDKTIAYLDSFINTLKDSFSSEKAEALRYRGMAKKYKKQYSEAIEDYKVSLEIERRQENKVGQIISLNMIGNAYRIERNYGRAADFYIQSLQIGEAISPTPRELGDTYNSLGIIFSARKKLDEAEIYFNQALRIRKESYSTLRHPTDDKKITADLADTYQDLGTMYYRKGLPDTALAMYIESETLNREIGNLYNLGKTYNNISAIHTGKENYSIAIDYLNKSLEIKKELGDDRGIAVATYNICELYYIQTEYNKALDNCSTSISYAMPLKDYEILSRAEFINYKIKKSQKENDKALIHHESYIIWKDSLNNPAKDVEIQRIISRYESDKQKAEAEKEKIIEQQRVQKQRNLLITGMLSALVVAFGLFFYSTAKKKLHEEEKKRRIQEEQLNKEIEGRRIEEQKLYNQVIKNLEKDTEIQAVNAEIDARLEERTKVSSQLHDSVCSGLVSAKMHFESIQNNITDNDKKVFVKGLYLLDDAYSITREISHELNPPMLEKFGLSQATEDLCEKLSTPQIDLQFGDTQFDDRLTQQQELTLFQSIQELLQNILKHSAATEAHVQLTDYGDSLNIMVEDNGKGFDTAEISESGIGLQKIRTRVKHLGGSMDVDSSPGNGTTVIIDVPKLLIPENQSIS